MTWDMTCWNCSAWKWIPSAHWYAALHVEQWFHSRHWLGMYIISIIFAETSDLLAARPVLATSMFGTLPSQAAVCKHTPRIHE